MNKIVLASLFCIFQAGYMHAGETTPQQEISTTQTALTKEELKQQIEINRKAEKFYSCMSKIYLCAGVLISTLLFVGVTKNGHVLDWDNPIQTIAGIAFYPTMFLYSSHSSHVTSNIIRRHRIFLERILRGKIISDRNEQDNRTAQ